MTLMMQHLKRIDPIWAIILPFVLGAIGLAIPSPSETAARIKCDEVVNTLFTSRDPVEIQRAGILVDKLQCSIRQRLPTERM